MKKIILAALLAGTGAFADSTYSLFAGAEFGQSKVHIDTFGLSDNENTYGARFGYIDDASRYYLVYDYVDVSEAEGVDELWQSFTFNLEALSKTFTFSSWLQTTFAVGAHIGFLNIAIDNTASSATVTFDKDETDLMYGVQGSALFHFTPHLSTELGYRYSRTSVTIADLDVNRLQTLYAAINYRF